MATYYMSPFGNDLNPGTQANPFYSLQRGYNALSAGDTLLLMDGTYVIHDTIACLCQSGGSLLGGYKTIRAMNKGMAILDGENVGQYCFDINGNSYIKVKDLKFTRWRWYPIFENTHVGSKWVWFQGNVVYDSGNILNVGAPDYLAGGGVFIGYGASFWIITQNKFYRVGARGYEGYRLKKDHALYTQATSPYTQNIEFSYNECWQISGNAIDLSSDHSLIVNNTIAWSTSNVSDGASIGIIDSGSAPANIIANNQWYQLSDDTPGAVLERTTFTGNDRWYVLGNMSYGQPFWYGYRYDSFLLDPNGVPYDNWSQTDSKYGQVDPKFVHAIKGDWYNVDFHLQQTSPGIDKGYPIKLFSLLGEQYFAQNPNFLMTDLLGTPSTLARDLDGVTASAKPAIGCYEYNGLKAVYYNTLQTAYYQRNNCGAGYLGSRVLYSVAAGTYSSTISQADADNKALQEIATNAQAYANANGTCSIVDTGGGGSTGLKTVREYYEIGATGVTWGTNGEVITKKS